MQRREEAEKLIAENMSRDPYHIPTRALTALLTLQDGVYFLES
jgi:hypothetical protein